jgi:hypothetical protein
MGGSFEAQAFLTAARQVFTAYGVSDVMLEDGAALAELGSDPNSGHGSRVSRQGFLGSDSNFAVPLGESPKHCANLGFDPNNPDPNSAGFAEPLFEQERTT